MAVFVVVSCQAVLAAPSVSITGNGKAWSDAVVLTLAQMRSHGTILETVDPNFVSDGPRTFRGTPLTDLLSLAGLENSQGLTVIGADQYVGYLTPERVSQGLLVWEMDGGPVSGLKGGPLKIMFPRSAGVHASCFTWYVTAMVQGRPKAPDITVVVNGKETRYPFADLVSRSTSLSTRLISIAQGCRNDFTEPTFDKPARAVALSDLTGSLSGGAAVEVLPYYGPAISLKPQAVAFGARIIVSCGKASLHPALGGPYAMVFPVEAHPELREAVPESGAFFFLKKIVVK